MEIVGFDFVNFGNLLFELKTIFLFYSPSCYKTYKIFFTHKIFLTHNTSLKYIYYMDESVLLGTKPLVDSIRHSIRDPSGVFSV